jgi:LysR family transcriptional regulator, hypochlorite-specific transcription factor HypT
MRLDWLDDILAVAKTGSFSDAAAQRHLTASAFSRRIRTIEDYVGIPMFDRTRKPVQLRPVVADQRDHMERLAAELRQLVGELRRGDRTAGNRIVLASQHALTAALTPGLVGRIHDRHAGLYLRLRSANLDECFALLLGRQADIALVYRVTGTDHPIDADYVETAVIGTDRLIPVFATQRIAALHAALAAGSLPVIAYPRDVFFGEVLERLVLPDLWQTCRIMPVAETALTLAAQELALAALGAAWLPRSLAQDHLTGGRLTDLSDLLPSVALDVTAVRLTTRRTGIEDAVWALLTAPQTPVTPSSPAPAPMPAPPTPAPRRSV